MPNDSRPTIIDVASRAGVSKSLVSLVFRGAPNVSEVRREAVLKAAEELGYRRNAIAQSLVRQRSFIVGVMLSDLHNPFFTEVIDGITATAQEVDYRALFNHGDRSVAGERMAVETLLELQVDGLILVGTVVDEETLDRFAADTRLVLASRKTKSKLVDSVATDDLMGARLAVDHLVELGHQRIAHITGGSGAGAPERKRGFLNSMRRHGLGQEAQVVDGDYTEAGGIGGMEELLEVKDLPTAVFVANDQAAIGALRVLSASKIRVPADMSVIGYDDTYLAAFEHINLTSVRQETQTMGSTAVRLLLERIDDGRTEVSHVTLKPGLTVRGSTGRPGKERNK